MNEVLYFILERLYALLLAWAFLLGLWLVVMLAIITWGALTGRYPGDHTFQVLMRVSDFLTFSRKSNDHEHHR